MPKFELYVPRAYQASPRREPTLVRALGLALAVFGAAFGATFLLEPAGLASQESGPSPTALAAPCLPAPLARHAPLVLDRPTRARRTRNAPSSRADGDARLVHIDNPAAGDLLRAPDPAILAQPAEPPAAAPPAPAEAGTAESPIDPPAGEPVP